MSKRFLILMCSVFLIVPLLFMGCGSDGSDGKNGINGTNGTNGINGTDLTATAKPESCQICHETAGAQHQASYDQLYQDNVIQVSGIGVAYTAPNIVTTTFTMKKKNGKVLDDFKCEDADSLGIYFTPYVGGNRFEGKRQSLTASMTSDPPTGTTTKSSVAGGICTVTTTFLDNVADFTGGNGLVVVYGYDELVARIPNSRVNQEKYPFAAFEKLGAVDYASAANVEGCEKCHTVPFLKHGYIYGRVNHDPATDMYTCKACHLDDGAGGHFIWQLLVDDTERAAELWAQAPGDVEPLMDNTEKAKYAYKTRLMNDVHMSHAMEFEYPQSMATCNTCHGGKLATKVLIDNNFVVETCKSCHALTGSAESEKPQPSLTEIWANLGVNFSFHTFDATCNAVGCHVAGGSGKVFSLIHTGYDKRIYGTNDGVKYSSAIVVTIDNASFVDNTGLLTFGFSASGSLNELSGSAIAPTVSVGLYGYNTKDFIVDPHSGRQLEYIVGDNTHVRMTTVSAGGGEWVVSANLSNWADKIANGTVKRVEIAVLPRLEDPALPKTFVFSSRTGKMEPTGDNVVALNAPSRTFDLKANAFKDDFYPAIVKVADGCNNCHDALGTTFHTPDRGGNIVVCRLCHNTRSGGSHLEMASRSIDSYAHVIHSFQAFDIGSVHFDNVIESMFYDLKIESHFPTFGLTDCEACHVNGKYNPPNQAFSLPGVLSKSATLQGKERSIGQVPSYVTGPGSRACGACHRAEWIKEDDAVSLASFNSHTATNGYMLVNTDPTVLDNAISTLYSDVYFGTVLPMP